MGDKLTEFIDKAMLEIEFKGNDPAEIARQFEILEAKVNKFKEEYELDRIVGLWEEEKDEEE